MRECSLRIHFCYERQITLPNRSCLLGKRVEERNNDGSCDYSSANRLQERRNEKERGGDEYLTAASFLRSAATGIAARLSMYEVRGKGRERNYANSR